jgi:hypothetical protein
MRNLSNEIHPCDESQGIISLKNDKTVYSHTAFYF